MRIYTYIKEYSNEFLEHRTILFLIFLRQKILVSIPVSHLFNRRKKIERYNNILPVLKTDEMSCEAMKIIKF